MYLDEKEGWFNYYVFFLLCNVMEINSKDRKFVPTTAGTNQSRQGNECIRRTLHERSICQLSNGKPKYNFYKPKCVPTDDKM